jgi:hypothetical protein
VIQAILLNLLSAAWCGRVRLDIVGSALRQLGVVAASPWARLP